LSWAGSPPIARPGAQAIRVSSTRDSLKRGVELLGL